MIDNKKAIEHFTNRLGELEKARLSYESVWQDCIDHEAPDLDGYLNAKKDRDQSGDRNDTKIYDNSPVFSFQRGSAGLYATVNPPYREWLNLKPKQIKDEDDSPARKWLDLLMDLTINVFHESNFYDASAMHWLHQEVIGTSCTLVLPDYDDVCHYEVLNVGEYWLGVDAKGRVDSCYRKYTKTLGQIVAQFGDAVPKKIREQYKPEAATETPYKVVHVIERNNYNIGMFPKKYVSAYYLEGEHENTFLQVDTTDFFIVVAPRWQNNPGEIYGKFNPGRVALPDCKQLQQMVWDFYDGLQKVNSPPLRVGDGVMDSGSLPDITPGAVNIMSRSATKDNLLEPLLAANPDLRTQAEAIAEKRRQIDTASLVDLFMAITQRQDKDMTAEEVRRVSTEVMLGLAPATNNFYKEYLNPLVDITIQYILQAGLMPEPPEEIQGTQFEPEYVSALAQAQRASEIDRVLMPVQTVAQLAAALGKPELMDFYDLDGLVKYINKLALSPAIIQNAQDKIDGVRKARNQAAMAQQQLDQLQQGAAIAGQNVGPDSVMGKLAGVAQ